MLKDALDWLQAVAVKAATPQKLDVPGHDVVRYAVGGLVQEFNLPVPDRCHHAGTLADLVALANRFKGEGAAPVVWYDAAAVVLVVDDDAARADLVTLTLEWSDLFVTVRGLKALRPLDQRAFVRLLRIDLAGALDPGVLLNPVRKVRWEGATTAAGEVQKNRESLGKSIVSAVAGEGEIPEEVTLNIPVWKTPGESHFRVPVPCVVDVDALEHTFRLLPRPDAVDWAVARALESVVERLHEGLEPGVPAYHGRP